MHATTLTAQHIRLTAFPNTHGGWYTQRNIFRNLIKSTRNQIVFTIFQLIWIQTDVRLDPNQSENGKYNLISDWFDNISLCARAMRLIARCYSQNWVPHGPISCDKLLQFLYKTQQFTARIATVWLVHSNNCDRLKLIAEKDSYRNTYLEMAPQHRVLLTH